MLRSSRIRVSVTKYLQFLDIYGHDFSNYFLSHVRRLQTLEQFEPKKKKSFPWKTRKLAKSNTKKEPKDPKVYMRETIGNVSNILRYSTWDSAQEQLQNLPIQWDSYTVNQVLKTHPPMEKAWLFFNWASRLKRFKHDQFTYTTMLDIFGEAGRISSMKLVFQKMQEKGIKIDVVTYTSLLHWLSKDGDLEGSLKMWEEMKFMGCCPTVVSYTAYMKVLLDNDKVKEATDVYKEMLESGCAPNCHTYTVLMEYLAGSGKPAAALEILSKMQEAGVQPDKATCNILVQTFSRSGQTWAMQHILQYMKENHIVLRHTVYLEALKALKVAGESDELLMEVNPHLSFEGRDDEEKLQRKLTSDVQIIIDSGIVSNFLGKRNFIAVEHMLSGLIHKNIQLNPKIVSAIIQISCKNHRPSTALLAFKYGASLGVDIERSACLVLIGFFIRNNSFSELVEVVEEMVEAGAFMGTYLVSLLIYKLGRTQNCDLSERIFESLPIYLKNPATYTALIGAYVSSGDVEKGLQVFNTMRKTGISPSSGTYRMLIQGLEEAGRIYEVEYYKKEKKQLQGSGNFQETISVEEGTCDLLFGGRVMS